MHLAVAMERSDPTLDRFDPHDWPFYWMTQTVGRYLRRLETALKCEGLDVSRWRVLMAVGAGKAGVSELAELAIVKVPTMLKIVQRMQTEGLVRLEPRTSDGRFTDVSLTDQGKAARECAWQAAAAIYKSAFEEVGADEEASLNAMLKRIFERLD